MQQMKTRIQLLFVTLLFAQFTTAQDLNIKFLEQITGVSFWSIDDVMENGYGFKKIKDENGGKEKTYVKGSPDDLSTVLVLKILNSKKALNTLDIRAGTNYNLQQFKSDLVDNGYLYDGLNKIDMLVYKKDKMTIIIDKNPNSNSKFNQILLIPEIEEKF